MSEKTCLGIDIGNNRIKVAVKKGGSVRRLLVDTVPDGLMRDNHIVSYDAMGDFLRELLKRNRISIKKAHLCMPIHEIYIRNVTLPMMNVQQLKVNLPYEFHDYITEDMGKYIYDYAMLPDMDEDGQLHMIAVAASKELISSHQLMAKRAHIKLESIVPACETIFRFLKNKIASVPKGETPQDFAILDLGDTSVKLHFFTRGQYEVTRSMDYGIGSAVAARQDHHVVVFQIFGKNFVHPHGDVMGTGDFHIVQTDHVAGQFSPAEDIDDRQCFAFFTAVGEYYSSFFHICFLLVYGHIIAGKKEEKKEFPESGNQMRRW